jgi:hypothetical protein
MSNLSLILWIIFFIFIFTHIHVIITSPTSHTTTTTTNVVIPPHVVHPVALSNYNSYKAQFYN